MKIQFSSTTLTLLFMSCSSSSKNTMVDAQGYRAPKGGFGGQGASRFGTSDTSRMGFGSGSGGRGDNGEATTGRGGNRDTNGPRGGSRNYDKEGTDIDLMEELGTSP